VAAELERWEEELELVPSRPRKSGKKRSAK
jgi:hypothetical protein